MLIAAIAGACAAAGIAGFAVSELLSSHPTPVRVEDRGGSGAALIGGAFSLTNQFGIRMTEADLLGRFSLIYFGFTHCPDVCPTALQTMAEALDQLGPAAGEVTPVFVTIDPERDTAEHLGPYVRHFHERMVGLTGSAEDIARVARAYRVYYRRVESGGSYLMDHSSVVFLMGRDGRFLTHFTHEATPEAMAEQIRRRLTPAGT